MKTRIIPSSIVGGYDLIAECNEHVLLFGRSREECEQAQQIAEADPHFEKKRTAVFSSEW